MWKKLIYSIFVFMSPFSIFYVFIFRIIFARTSYAATVPMMHEEKEKKRTLMYAIF
jgi:hypothetical protein